MQNKEFVRKVIRKCEEIHPNLYHSVKKEKVEAFVESVEWDSLNEIEFNANVMKLFAIFKDAHTSYINNIPDENAGVDLYYINGEIYMRTAEDMLKVNKINGVSSEEVVEKISQLLNYETLSRRNYMVSNNLNNGYFYKMIGIAQNTLVFEVENANGENFVIEKEIRVVQRQLEQTKTQKQQKRPTTPKYDYVVVDGNILRLNYRSCQNMEGYPFIQFLEDMKKDIQDKNIEGIVVDLRGNGGGRSSIIVPFVEYVKENNWPCVVLMDNGTFSSGVIAVRDFKKHCDAVLIGEYAGQGTEHYGDCPPFELDGKKISCCTKHFDFSDVFGYKGPIKPDIYVQRTVEEFRTGQQTQQVRTAYETINKLIDEKRKEQTKTIE